MTQTINNLNGLMGMARLAIQNGWMDDARESLLAASKEAYNIKLVNESAYENIMLSINELFELTENK